MAKKKQQAITQRRALSDMKRYLKENSDKSDNKNLDYVERVLDIFLADVYLGKEVDDSIVEDVLMGFAFFLSGNRGFGYTQTFLNNKSEEYLRTRHSVSRQFTDVINHFNSLVEAVDTKIRNYRLQYNDLFVFKYGILAKRWKCEIKYDNLSNLLNSKLLFQLSVNTAANLAANEFFYTCDVSSDVEETVSDINAILG